MNTRSLVVTGHLYIGAHIIRDCLIIIDNNVSTGKAVFLSYLLWHYLERELPAVIHDITGKNICIFDQRSAGIPASPQSASSLGRYVGPHRDRFDARRFNLVGGMYRRTMSEIGCPGILTLILRTSKREGLRRHCAIHASSFRLLSMATFCSEWAAILALPRGAIEIGSCSRGSPRNPPYIEAWRPRVRHEYLASKLSLTALKSETHSASFPAQQLPVTQGIGLYI